jgi:hypothetical protein
VRIHNTFVKMRLKMAESEINFFLMKMFKIILLKNVLRIETLHINLLQKVTKNNYSEVLRISYQ